MKRISIIFRKKVQLFSLIVFAITTFTTPQAFAVAYHIFTNINYDNPADLNRVKKYNVILGGTYLHQNFQYKGINGPLSGKAESSRSSAYPYGRFAARITPKFVASFDVASYAYVDLRYPKDSFINTLSTGTIIRGYNFSPRFSYQVSKSLAIGAGFLADRMYKVNLDFFAGTPKLVSELVNRSQGWAFGWIMGLSYAINQQTFLSVSYASKLNHHAKGKSSWGSLTSDTFSVNVPIPAVTTANLVYVYTPKLIFSGTVRFVQWSVYRNLELDNTALGNILIPMSYKDSWYFQFGSRYQINENWGIGGTIIYQTNAQPKAFRPIALPTYGMLILGIAPEYAINKSFSIKLQYGFALSRPSIGITGPIGPVVGDNNIRGHLLDLSLDYHL